MQEFLFWEAPGGRRGLRRYMVIFFIAAALRRCNKLKVRW